MEDTMTFTNQFGSFHDGEPVLYSVFPLGTNIKGLAHKDRIETIDTEFLKVCESEQMSPYCLWENAHCVEKLP